MAQRPTFGKGVAAYLTVRGDIGVKWSGLAGVVLLAASPAVSQAPADAALQNARTCYSITVDLVPAERTLFCDAMITSPADPRSRLARVEAAISRIDRVTPANAMLLAMRGHLLASLGRDDEAVAALDAALVKYRQVPPLLAQAGSALVFSQRPDAAARYWTRLAQSAPELAKQIDGYQLGSLMERLDTTGHAREADELASLMYGLGYAEGKRVTRATLAARLVGVARQNNDLERLRTLLPDVRDPGGMRTLLSDPKLRPLWGEVAWSEPGSRERIVREWIDALAEKAPDSPHSGFLITALIAHVGPAPVLARFEPELQRAFSRPAGEIERAEYAFWVAPLARAHVIAGDEAAAERLYRAAIEAYTPFDSGTRLNADANLALFLADRRRHAEALAIVEPAIAALRAEQGVSTALLQMHAVRARALQGLGRWGEAWPSMELLREHADTAWPVYFNTLIQLGLTDDARASLLARLGSENYREAVAALQPGIAAFEDPMNIAKARNVAALVAHPAVQAALADRGRILDPEPVRLEQFDVAGL